MHAVSYGVFCVCLCKQSGRLKDVLVLGHNAVLYLYTIMGDTQNNNY
jgi:hypothetical protein